MAMLLTMVIKKFQEFYAFVPCKSFGQLLEISATNFIISKTFNLEFSYTEVLFTDQIFKPLGIVDRTSLT